MFSTLTLYSSYGIDEENLFNNQDIFCLLMSDPRIGLSTAHVPLP